MFAWLDTITLYIWCASETRRFHANNLKEQYMKEIMWIRENRDRLK